MKRYTICTVLLACCPAAFAGTLSPGLGFSNAYTEGLFQGVTVAQFNDSDPNEPFSNLMAMITWGDNTSSAGTIVAIGGGAFGVSGSHTYFDEGNYAITTTASVSGGNSVPIQSSATVSDAPLTNGPPGTTVVGTEGATLNGTVGTFTDANPLGNASDFTATINWGDGTLSFGTVSSGGGGLFFVSGGHAYAQAGAYTITSNISDKGGSTVVTGGSAQIDDAALSPGPFLLPSLIQGDNFNGILAGFADANPFGIPSDFMATINWGDGVISPGAVVATTTPGVFSIGGQHTYADSGVFPVFAQVSDFAGSSVQVMGTENVSPATATPEPASLDLIAIGLVLWGVTRAARRLSMTG